MREGSVAVVTGGSSGIGLAIGRELLARGGHVVLVGRDPRRGEEAVRSLASERVRFETADVTDAAAIDAVVSRAARSHGRLDYMFNNAGVSLIAEACDLGVEDWRRVIEINLMGVINGVAACYPIMIAQGSGHIVNTSSLSGLLPAPFGAPYAAAKHGVVGLSLSLRYEAEAHGVRVSVACPGLVQTPIFETTQCVGLRSQDVVDSLPGKPMDAGACAREILRDVDRNVAVIKPGVASPIAALHRWLPTLSNVFARRMTRTLVALKKNAPRQLTAGADPAALAREHVR
jgi:NAD(P)-dependent dehydrogenase (short-subunit alcohol dehydrogenase family)